jgi:hypothetical protein
MLNIRHQIGSTINRTTSGGKAAPAELLRGTKKHAINLRATYDVTIVGAGGGTVNAEGTSRLINVVRVIENGITRIELSGRALGYFTQRALKQAANIGALAGAGAQANTILRADYVIDFASIYGADPGEVCFVERDARFPTIVEIEFATSPEAALISGTGLTLNSGSVEISELHDPNSQVMPFFLPRIKRLTSPAVTGTQSAFRIPLLPEGNNRVESVLLHGVTDDVSDTGVLTGAVTLRGDRERYIDNVDVRTLLNEQRRMFFSPAPAASYVEMYLRRYGKLSEMYVASQDDNWRVEAAVANPGVTTTIDSYTVEREAVPGYTRDIPPGW